jgi:hypothetical protein
VPALAAVLIDCDPIRMRVIDVLMTRMSIRPRNHIHSKLPASRDYIAERVHRPEPSASIVERDFGGKESYGASCAQTSGICMNLSEIVEPERKIVVSRIVFHKCQLCPAHGTPVPPQRIGID